MTSHEDLDRVLASWFEDEASSSIPDGGLDRVRNATGARRPLPAWIAGLGSRWVERTRQFVGLTYDERSAEPGLSWRARSARERHG